jgi:integrase
MSDAAVALLKSAKAKRPDCEIIFPSPVQSGQPLSNNAMLALLDRIGHGDVTVHGMRSAFRDWVGECTSYPRELAEKALAHTVGNETEQAYQRGDLLERRREIMDAWANYCGPSPAGNVEALGDHRSKRQAKA